MVEYNKVNVKSSNSQLYELKTAAKNETRVTLRMNIKMFNGNNLRQELLLTTRPKTKLRNAFENNMSTDIKLSKAQISKIGFLDSLLSKIAGPLMKVAVPNCSLYFQKKMHGSGTTTLIITKEEINYITKIV